jgi:putative tryptophan/tyrosine transport system substrate-binding protein
MKRRRFMPLLGGIVGLAAQPGWAQKSALPVIGYLNSIPPSPDLLGELRRGLANGGFVEGQNVRIDYRSAEGRYDRLPQLAAELVRQKVNVIMTTGGTTSVVAAKAATDTIPIAGVIGDDPTRVGLAQSLGHPGGNVTGVAQLVTIAEGKRLEFIHAIAPAAPTVAYLANPELPLVRQRLADVEDRGARARDQARRPESERRGGPRRRLRRGRPRADRRPLGGQ